MSMSVEEIYNRKWNVIYEDEIIISDGEIKFCYKDGDCIIYKDDEIVGEIYVEGYSDCDDVEGVYRKVAYLLWFNPPEYLI